MQIYRTMLWAHLWGNMKCWTSETPLPSGGKEDVVNQRQVTHQPLSMRGAVPKAESCRFEDSDFGWMAFFRSIRSVALTGGIFLCILLRWEQCLLLYHRCPGPTPRSMWAKVSQPRLEAGAEHNYPAPAAFHARRLSPRHSETRLLFCLFSRWNLRHELQNTKWLRLRLPLWVPFPPLALTASPGKVKTLRSPQKKGEISAGRAWRANFSAVEFWVPCSSWCDLLT